MYNYDMEKYDKKINKNCKIMIIIEIISIIASIPLMIIGFAALLNDGVSFEEMDISMIGLGALLILFLYSLFFIGIIGVICFILGIIELVIFVLLKKTIKLSITEKIAKIKTITKTVLIFSIIILVFYCIINIFSSILAIIPLIIGLVLLSNYGILEYIGFKYSTFEKTGDKL